METMTSADAPDEQRSAPWAPIVAVALVVALLAGLAGWLIGRDSHPANDSVEAGFARDMAAHHIQAVEMALMRRIKQALDPLGIMNPGKVLPPG